MNRLIKANFARLFKSIFFRVCMIFSAGLGIFLDLARYIDIQRNQELYANYGVEYKSADGFAFSGGLYLIFVAAAFTAIFIGTDYSEGTIRNKLMSGSKRTEIYLSNFITCAVANIIILMIFIIVTLGFGYTLFHATCLNAKETAVYIASQCVTMVSFSAIITLLSMLIQSKSGGAVTALITTIVLFYAALTISSSLNSPEYYDDYQMTKNETTGEMELVPVTEKNPRYLTGTKREIYEALNNILPVNQFYQTTSHIDDNINIMAVYSAIIIILANGAGLIIFRKKDLK